MATQKLQWESNSKNPFTRPLGFSGAKIIKKAICDTIFYKKIPKKVLNLVFSITDFFSKKPSTITKGR